MAYNRKEARLFPAFCRAYHAKNAENPVFYDNVAEKLLSEDDYREISRYITENEVFAPETLAEILEKHGFLIYELLCPYDINERYFKGRKDGLSAFENIWLADAVLKKRQ